MHSWCARTDLDSDRDSLRGITDSGVHGDRLWRFNVAIEIEFYAIIAKRSVGSSLVIAEIDRSMIYLMSRVNGYK